MDSTSNVSCKHSEQDLLLLGQSWCFGFQITEILRQAGEPIIPPSREYSEDYLAELHRRMVALFTTFNPDWTTPSIWEIRYIIDPTVHPQDQENILVVLICKFNGEKRSAADHFQSTACYLQAEMTDYTFKPLTASMLVAVINPFQIRQLVSIERRCAIVPFGEYRVGKAGFRAFPRIGISPSTTSSGAGSVLHIASFTRHLAPIPVLLSYLLQLKERVVLSVRLQRTALSSQEEDFLFDQVGMCDAFIASHQAGISPVIESQMIAEQAQLHRQSTYLDLNRLSENALLMVIQVAAADTLSPLTIALAGNCVTSPAGAQLDLRPNDAWFEGGYDIRQLTAPEDFAAFEQLEIVTPCLRDFPEPARRLPYIYAPEEAAYAFYLPPRFPAVPPGIPFRKHHTLPVPGILPETGCLLGTSQRDGSGRCVRIGEQDRMRHTYIIGQTGTGKTTLLQSMILDDIRNGQGLCFIDPHGDAFHAILERIPPEQKDNVIAFDVTQPGPAIGLNILEAEDIRQRYFVAQELLHIIYRMIVGSYGQSMAEFSIGPVFFQHLRMNALLAMSNPDDPGTLLELYNVFTMKDYWHRWLPLIDADPVLDAWVHQTLEHTDYIDPKRDTNSLGSYIASKLENFVFDPRLRQVFGQKKTTLNLPEIMNTGKVLLVNIAKGELSDENSRFLGMVILGKLLSAIQERVQLPKEQRRPFHLYVDEFQNLATPSFTVMLSEARKFGLSLVLANQFISQITDHSVVSAIAGNVGTIVAFRLGRQDAEIMQSEFLPHADALDLANLPNFEAYCRLLYQDSHLNPFSLHTIKPAGPGDPQLAQQILADTAQRYGTPDYMVNKTIEWSMTPVQPRFLRT